MNPFLPANDHDTPLFLSGTRRLPDVEDFNKACTTAQRRCGMRVIVVLIGMVICASWAIAVHARFHSAFGEIVGQVIFAFAFTAALISYMAFTLRWADRPYSDYDELTCPHCRKLVAAARQLVVATGNCPHCGRRVIKDELHGT